MLCELIPKLTNNKIVSLINKFLYSKLYIVLIGVLTLLCNIFSFEIPLFYIVVTLGAIIPFFFCGDYLPAIAPLSMTYVSISWKANNVTLGTSLFGGSKVVHLYVLVVLIALFIIPRLIYDVIRKKERRVKPRLWLGFILLLPCYVLGGIFSGHFEGRTALYGLVNFLSISGCYFVILYALNWKNINKDYFFWVMMVLGLVVTSETIYMFIANLVANNMFAIKDVVNMYAGWGMRNNIAAQIALCVAAPLYLAIKWKKLNWLYILASVFMVFGCMCTNSRGGTFVTGLIFAAGFIVLLIKSNKKQRIIALTTVTIVFVSFRMFYILEKNLILEAFPRIFDPNSTVKFLNGRQMDWAYAISDFKENIFTGVGFYKCKAYQFFNFSTGFVPPRYHNIYLQYLASTGLVGLFAYLFHRYQTLKLTFRKPTLEKTFIYFTVIALVLTSMVDNHFFNMGPGLNYCVALAFIEGIEINKRLTTNII